MSEVAVSLQAQLDCARREVGMRKKAYPRFVQRGMLTQQTADNELAAMEAIVATLKGLLAQHERHQGELW